MLLAVMAGMPLLWHRVSAAKVQHPPKIAGVLLAGFRPVVNGRGGSGLKVS